MNSSPRISVIIVNHNGGEFVRCAVESAVAQSYPDHEVVLVDNGSDDDSLASVTESPFFRDSLVRVRVIRLQRNMGCSGGRNAGIQAADGELLAFLDSDAVAPSGWLTAVAEVMSSSDRVGIVASTSLSMRNPRVMQSQGGVLTLSGHAVDLGFGEPWEFTHIDEPLTYAMGNGLVSRREVVDKIGLFDEACRNYYEDVDFCLRAQLAGYEIKPCRSEPLLHYGGSSDIIFGDKPILLERHRIRTALRSFGGAMLARWLFHELLAIARGGASSRRRVRLRAWMWNLARFYSILSHRISFPHRFRTPDEVSNFRPSWVPVRSLEHSGAFTPESGDLERGIVIGEEHVGAIAYGFYWAEQGLGERFRWTNGLGSLLVRSSRRIGNIVLRLHCPRAREHRGGISLVVLMDRASNRSFAGWIEPSDEGWVDYQMALDLPPGAYELLLLSIPTAVETHHWGRKLGVAVASVRCD